MQLISKATIFYFNLACNTELNIILYFSLSCLTIINILNIEDKLIVDTDIENFIEF